ncbi:uncharacterized protein G2W53_041536 [Senna tora]|uniref:Uncharacterized protein n=1 Tax=Senna tora TaxID=362788 RepID=A0A834SH73_9FABA|nr:uncharacterized protein G2W53_041536 [Senna tora]
MGASGRTKLEEIDQKTDPSKWVEQSWKNLIGRPTNPKGRTKLKEVDRKTEPSKWTGKAERN